MAEVSEARAVPQPPRPSGAVWGVRGGSGGDAKENAFVSQAPSHKEKKNGQEGYTPPAVCGAGRVPGGGRLSAERRGRAAAQPLLVEPPAPERGQPRRAALHRAQPGRSAAGTCRAGW